MKKLSRLTAGVLLAMLSWGAQAGMIQYNLPNVSNSNSTDAINNWFSTSAINGTLDSFTLSMNWKDQGWGNRKGRIFYRTDTSGWQDLGILAEHFWTSPMVTIMHTLDTNRLHLGYIVGGGGGHRLYINNAQLTLTTVPEPASLGVMAAGIAGLVMLRRRKLSQDA